MHKLSIGPILVLCALLCAGCDNNVVSSIQFRLPDGDPVSGREAFLEMQCNQCHFVAGDDFPRIPAADPPFIELGGRTSRVTTYGELLTAIINPSHKLADGFADSVVPNDRMSKTHIYNDYMSVSELTDLVMFLLPHYDVVIPDYAYPIYPELHN